MHIELLSEILFLIIFISDIVVLNKAMLDANCKISQIKGADLTIVSAFAVLIILRLIILGD